MNNYHLVSFLLDQFIRPNDDPSVDHLIIKASLFTYINRNQMDKVEKDGIQTPVKLMESHPEEAKKIYGDLATHPIYKKCVFAFFCRVPTENSNIHTFTQNNVPVKILTSRLARSHDKFQFLSCNFPGSSEPKKLNEEVIRKLSQKEDVMFKHFNNSKHPYLLDVPLVAIYCENGELPGFVCKVLRDSTKDGVQ